MVNSFTFGVTKPLFFSLIFLFSINTLAAQSAFISTWKTNNPGSSNSTSITIPAYPETVYNYDVDWDNDGTYDELGITGAITHNFASEGTYTIRIRGLFPRIYFGGEGDKDKILDIAQWGDFQWQSMNKAFNGCSNLNISATDAPDLSQVSDFTSIFNACTSFNSSIDHWDVSKVESFYFAFANCSSFNQPLNNWDMSSATTFQRMFIGCTVFNQPLDKWEVGHVPDFAAMFNNCKSFNQPLASWEVGNAKYMGLMFAGAANFNQDIGNWDLGNIISVKAMFHGATSFNQDISNWNVSNVKNMYSLFKGAKVFNQDISNWEVGNVTNMGWMFASATSFNQDISGWDVSQVTNMSYLFFVATSFNQDISSWDVSKVTSMNNTFNRASAFNQDISGWDVSQVTNMGSMFHHAISFDQNLGNWDVSQVTTMVNMFSFAELSTPNYDQLLIGWNELQLQEEVDFHGGYSIYCLGGEARANIILVNSWTIKDGGSEKVAPQAICQDLTIYLDPSGHAEIDDALLDNGSFDECTEVTFSTTQTDFNCSHIGEHQLTLTVTDAYGNSSTCVAQVTVLDTFLQFVCPADISLSPNSAGCMARAEWLEPVVNCGTTLSASHQSGDLFPVGTTTVTYTATDAFANAISCSFDIVVRNRLGMDILSIEHPRCRDANDGQVFLKVINGQAPYTFDWDYDGTGDFDDQKDQGGLSDRTHQVTVMDNVGCITQNSITLHASLLNIQYCPADITISPNQSGCKATVTWEEPVEICSGAPLSSNYNSGDTFELGTTVVNYIADNVWGESATCTFTVTVVEDNTCMEITDVATTTEELNCPNADVQIYPNPGKGVFSLTLASCQEEASIEVYDFQGRKIYREQINAAKSNFNLDHLAPSTYLLKVNSGGETFLRPLVIIE